MYTYIRTLHCISYIHTIFSCPFYLSKAGGKTRTFQWLSNSWPPQDWSSPIMTQATPHVPCPLFPSPLLGPGRQILSLLASFSVFTIWGFYWMMPYIPSRTPDPTESQLRFSHRSPPSLPASPASALLPRGLRLHSELHFPGLWTICHTVRGSAASLTDCWLILLGTFFLASYRAY